MRRLNTRADCSNEQASFDGPWPLSSVAETEVRQHPSGHPTTGSAKPCPAATSHNAGRSEQITVFTRSIVPLTPRPPYRSIGLITKNPLIWNPPQLIFLNSVIPPSHFWMVVIDLIEHSPLSCHLLRVRSVKTMLALLLALAWAPMMAHCTLETVSGLQFLRCAADTQSSPANTDPCGDNGCCAVESANYQAPSHQQIVPVWAIALLPFDILGDLEPSPPPKVGRCHLSSAPPELSTAWQFISRTAPPCRAPSLAS
jgi:hypothetical protein